MEMIFEMDTSLPRMSWCAAARENGSVVVRYGDMVETRPGAFAEGAWDGDFEQFDFDRAVNLAGSGGVLRDGGCVFAAPFHPLECLYALRLPGEVLVSNSLVFLLERAEDRPDPGYPDYFFDFVRMVRRGIARQPVAVLRTLGKKQVEIYVACHLVLDQSLNLSWRPSPMGPPPANFGDYFEMLTSACRAIVENAADPGRKESFTPVAACSRGYDSTAATAVARRVGCRRGVTFVSSSRYESRHPLLGTERPMDNDSGTDTLRSLGMSATEFDRLKILEVPGFPKAEFFYGFTALTDYCMRLMEAQLENSVLFSGRHGERYWGPTSRCRRRHYREVDDVSLSGRTSTEFRLRVGYVHLPVPYIGALHGPAIHRITHLPEMQPWRLNVGYYDRPIARRIAEEAGVPREYFGQVKYGGGEQAMGMNDDSERDLRDFIMDRVPPEIKRRLHMGPIADRKNNYYRIKYIRVHYSHFPMMSRTLELLGSDRLHRLWNSAYLYLFHWGVDKTRVRYTGK